MEEPNVDLNHIMKRRFLSWWCPFIQIVSWTEGLLYEPGRCYFTSIDYNFEQWILENRLYTTAGLVLSSHWLLPCDVEGDHSSHMIPIFSPCSFNNYYVHNPEQTWRAKWVVTRQFIILTTGSEWLRHDWPLVAFVYMIFSTLGQQLVRNRLTTWKKNNTFGVF